ncbi:hypothetical protein PAE4_10891 [Bacillus altitudinis]|nr:hypothetical protein PAE4_10891 [Bacillus altitudinis]
MGITKKEAALVGAAFLKIQTFYDTIQWLLYNSRRLPA